MGEPIGFEISYASQTERKYLTSQSNPTPEFGSIVLHLAPLDGALDPRSLRLCWGGFAGSFLSSGPRYLNSQPISEHAELTNWYRFQKPGHYSLAATSRAVSRSKSADEGGGQEILTLESNTVEFDILPRDPAWEALELKSILLDLDNAKNPGDRIRPLNRLSLLDTPDSARKLVELYLTISDGDRYSYASSLTQSSQVDLVVPLLEAALSKPEVSPSGIADLLAQLQVRRQLGVVLTAVPDDAVAQQKSQVECKERRALYDNYLARNNALLLRIARQTGPQQSAAIYEVWRNAEDQSARGGQAAEDLTQLRLAALNVAEKLEPDQQTQFVITEWKIMSHEQLLPVIRNLVAMHRLDGEKLWCEGWPRECSEAILSDAVKPDSQLSAVDALLISEAEHSEIDSALQEQLRDPRIVQGSKQNQRTAALVLRAGSHALLPAVDDALTRLAASRNYSCEVEAYLVGYLFKVAQEDGQRRLSEMLQDARCGAQLFRVLNTARFSDDLIPVAVKGLDSSNLDAAATAALFLGDHGTAQVEDALWKRLEALRALWHDRAGELQITIPTTLDRGVQAQSTHLEQSLASALSHATNWNLTEAQRGRLRDSCLTEQCRNIADGKMRLGY